MSFYLFIFLSRYCAKNVSCDLGLRLNSFNRIPPGKFIKFESYVKGKVGLSALLRRSPWLQFSSTNSFFQNQDPLRNEPLIETRFNLLLRVAFRIGKDLRRWHGSLQSERSLRPHGSEQRRPQRWSPCKPETDEIVHQGSISSTFYAKFLCVKIPKALKFNSGPFDSFPWVLVENITYCRMPLLYLDSIPTFIVN